MNAFCAHHKERGWLIGTLAETKRQSMDKLISAFSFGERSSWAGIRNEQDLTSSNLVATLGWEVKPVCLLTEERLKELENFEHMYKGLEE